MRRVRTVALVGMMGIVGGSFASAATMGDRSLAYRMEAGYPLPKPIFPIEDEGEEGWIDFSRFGVFHDEGTADYHYELTDPEGLRRAMGVGLYPDPVDVEKEPGFARMASSGRLAMDTWQALESDDLRAAFYVWARSAEPDGVRLFFTGRILERAGHIRQALKAYRAALVLFPRAVAWGRDGTFFWYVAPAALAASERLCRDYPALACRIAGAEVVVENGEDMNLDNDRIVVHPGRMRRLDPDDRIALYPGPAETMASESRGEGRVRVVRLANGHWQLRVDGAPYVVRGIRYEPTAVGEAVPGAPIYSTAWMTMDSDGDGVLDAPYESWVDRDLDGVRDEDEPVQGDFALLRAMGVNTILVYAPLGPDGYDPSALHKPVLRDLYERFGIRVIVGHYFGAYGRGSGAGWVSGTDYTDPGQRARILESVGAMVRDLEDEPFVLFWLLGEDTNTPGRYFGVNPQRTNAFLHPRAYASLLQEAAEEIHRIDGDHPVAVGNMELGLLDDYRRWAPAVDVLGVSSYRGPYGFEDLWREVRRRFDRPVLITAYGQDAYDERRGVDEESQRAYHEGCLRDIVFHLGGGRFTGNAIGGVIFEFLDGWGRDPEDPADHHSREASGERPYSDGRYHSEWMGLAGQGDGRGSPFLRRLRSAYTYYKEMWGR